MAVLFSALGHRHPLQKRRPRSFSLTRQLPVLGIAITVITLYWVMMPDQLFSRIFGGSKGSAHLNDAGVWVSTYLPYPSPYFPPSFDCVCRGHTTMTHILAQRVWISFSGRVIITCIHSRINTGGLLTSDSRVRIERLAPEKWTADDVGVWLGNEVCISIRSDSICSVDWAIWILQLSEARELAHKHTHVHPDKHIKNTLTKSNSHKINMQTWHAHVHTHTFGCASSKNSDSFPKLRQ